MAMKMTKNELYHPKSKTLGVVGNLANRVYVHAQDGVFRDIKTDNIIPVELIHNPKENGFYIASVPTCGNKHNICGLGAPKNKCSGYTKSCARYILSPMKGELMSMIRSMLTIISVLDED